jgi:hypothetical protein
MADRSRLDSLARRVQWADRYRHLLAFLVAAAITPVLVARLSEAVDLDWRSVQIILGTMIGTVVWLAVEVIFATLVAAWELRHERLAARAVVTRRLPTARIVRRLTWVDRVVRRAA